MDGLGLPEKRTGRESSLGSMRCTTAGRGATAELIRWYLEHPRQGGAGMRPWLNCSKLNLSWETVSVYIRRHSSTGRKARYLFFGKITNVQGSEPPSGSRGIFFINLTGQTKTLNHPNFHFLFWKIMSPSHQTSETKSAFPGLWPFSVVCRPESSWSYVFKEHGFSVRR